MRKGKEVSQDVEAFLNSGGKIQTIPRGVSAFKLQAVKAPDRGSRRVYASKKTQRATQHTAGIAI